MFTKKIPKFLTSWAVTALFMLLTAVAFAADAPVVHVTQGDLRGVVENGIDAYKGVPYAKPPVGELRWQPPVAPDAWTGVRDATQYANEAAQNADLGVFSKAGGSEDCLYLNVFVDENQKKAAAEAGKALPVFVWIHGGGLITGSGNDYNPSALAKQGAVVVTVNYRLGVLGFFAHPAIDKEDHAKGNYGLMDQQMALRWVQDNIAAFGGDKNNVTLAGESSGGNNVLNHMASPLSAGLFQNAISMSGATNAINSAYTLHTLKDQEQEGIAFAKRAGLKENATAAQLRALPLKKILKAQSPDPLFAMVDGTVLTMHPLTAFKSGNFNHPQVFINGIVRDEGSFFVGQMEAKNKNRPLKRKDYDAVLGTVAGSYDKANDQDFIKNLQQEYDVKKYDSYAQAGAAAQTDAWFAFPADQLNQLLSYQIPVYAYEFADETAPAYQNASFPQGAAHTYELSYLFPGFNGASSRLTALSEKQQKVADTMTKLWADPAKAEENGWQKYDPSKGNYLTFTADGAAMTEHQFAAVHHLDFWQKALQQTNKNTKK